jgi:hypothetical protein
MRHGGGKTHGCQQGCQGLAVLNQFNDGTLVISVEDWGCLGKYDFVDQKIDSIGNFEG